VISDEAVQAGTGRVFHACQAATRNYITLEVRTDCIMCNYKMWML